MAGRIEAAEQPRIFASVIRVIFGRSERAYHHVKRMNCRGRAMEPTKDVIIRTSREDSPIPWILLAIGLPTVIPGLLALITQL
jgi:hypothetical protein